MITWARLASIISPDESPPRLRSDVLAHALQATGFWREESLARFMKPPWSNVRGDVVGNAEDIQDAAPDTLDSETLKLHRLMQMGEITVHQVASFLRCFGQSPCSTFGIGARTFSIGKECARSSRMDHRDDLASSLLAAVQGRRRYFLA